MDLQLQEILFFAIFFFFQGRNYGFYLIWINLYSLKWSRFLTFSPHIKGCKKGKILAWARYQQVQLDLMKIYLYRYFLQKDPAPWSVLHRGCSISPLFFQFRLKLNNVKNIRFRVGSIIHLDSKFGLFLFSKK